MEIKTQCLSPKCDDTTNHLWINTDKGIFHCWKCDWKGKISTNETVLRFLKKKGKQPHKSKTEQEAENKELFNNEYTDLEKLPSRHMAVKYLKMRNVSIPLCKQVEAAYCHRGFLSGRIVFPIRYNGKVECIQGRTVYGREPKYLTAGKKRLALFGTKLLSEYEDYIIIFEGIFDVLRMPEHGIAILGKVLSDEQINALSLLLTTKKVFIMFDADAKEYTETAYRALINLFNVTPVYLKTGDPGSMRKEEILRCCKNSLNA